MWIFSCDGDHFSGRRKWLRPGSRHLIGRTSNREPGHTTERIDEKSVSRKHLVIVIDNVIANDSTQIHARTKITITDDSKTGTKINGDSLKKGSRSLSGRNEYIIQLGNYAVKFRLQWQPVNLTLANLPKKEKNELMAGYRQQLSQLDVKLVLEFVQETTHLVARKRNIPQVLQALAQARWVVGYEFLERLAKAVHQQGFDEHNEPNLCPLEVDFDDNWPKELDAPAPTGTEPVKRPASFLAPKPERAEVFKNFTFVFLSRTQYESLLPVVTSGGGKAVVWEVVTEESKVGDLQEYIQELAGQKGNRRYLLSQRPETGGIVVVRILDRDVQWTKDFLHEVDTMLGQRSIEQYEFLDAIMLVDASSLKKELRDDGVTQSVPPSASVPPPASIPLPPRGQARATPPALIQLPDSPPPRDHQHQPMQQVADPQQQPQEQRPAELEPAPRRRNRRVITQSRLKRFDDDDDFDPSQFQKPDSLSPPPLTQSREASQAPSVQDIDEDGPSRVQRTQRGTQNTRKRPAQTELQRDNEMLDDMLQGQAAMKRMRMLSSQRDGGVSSSRACAEPGGKDRPLHELPPQKKTKERDYKAEMAAKREKEEEDRRQEEETLRNDMTKDEISKLRDLAEVAEMELPVRERPTHRANESARSDRWDLAWDGRKNFKKFRPQGQVRAGERPSRNRVMIALEEVPRKGHGIGEEYWQTSPSHQSSRKLKPQSESQTIRNNQSQAEDQQEEPLTFHRRLQRVREEDEQDAKIVDGGIRGTVRTQTQTRGKRPASGAAPGAPPAKKTRQTRLPITISEPTSSTARETVIVDEDEDDDGLKVRRKRR